MATAGSSSSSSSGIGSSPNSAESLGSARGSFSENKGSSSGDCEMAHYKKSALEAVKFQIIYEKEDLKCCRPSQTFKPQMAYQIFGESESIFGYLNPTITLNYLHNSCKCYVDIKTKGVIKNQNVEPDDIMEKLNEWLPGHYTLDPDEFAKRLDEEVHDQMWGDVICKFPSEKPVERYADKQIFPTLYITKIDEVYLNKDFRAFHERFETFIIWFINEANFIDLDDEKWMIYYIFEEFQHPVTKQTYCSPVGFCSVYKFYAYPDLIRPRISQVFILPTHQSRGIGTKLYKTVVKDLRAMEESKDITVEEPTIQFRKIRDLDDCLIVQNEVDVEKLSLSQVLEVAEKKKISKLQALRIYDILGCVYSKRKSETAYLKFIQSIKRRIDAESKRNQNPGKRFRSLDKSTQPVSLDQEGHIEALYKKRLDELQPSIQYFCNHSSRKREYDEI